MEVEFMLQIFNFTKIKKTKFSEVKKATKSD